MIVSVTLVGVTLVVVGTEASRTASLASWVPGTAVLTWAAGLSSGIRAKSAGRSLLAGVHGPSRPGARNQRPATRK